MKVKKKTKNICRTFGGEHWMTRSTSGMSRPRAATLVATNTSNVPFLKPLRVISLCFWGMSPCSTCAFWTTANGDGTVENTDGKTTRRRCVTARYGTCLMDEFMESSVASFLVSQKTMVRPWLPLYTWMTSPMTDARWDQWLVIAKCCAQENERDIRCVICCVWKQNVENAWYNGKDSSTGDRGCVLSNNYKLQTITLMRKQFVQKYLYWNIRKSNFP